MKLEGYGIVNGADTDPNAAQQKLIDSMLVRIKQGWIPQGGMGCFVIPTSPQATFFFFQAIVKSIDAD